MSDTHSPFNVPVPRDDSAGGGDPAPSPPAQENPVPGQGDGWPELPGHRPVTPTWQDEPTWQGEPARHGDDGRHGQGPRQPGEAWHSDETHSDQTWQANRSWPGQSPAGPAGEAHVTWQGDVRGRGETSHQAGGGHSSWPGADHRPGQTSSPSGGSWPGAVPPQTAGETRGSWPKPTPPQTAGETYGSWPGATGETHSSWPGADRPSAASPHAGPQPQAGHDSRFSGSEYGSQPAADGYGTQPGRTPGGQGSGGQGSGTGSLLSDDEDAGEVTAWGYPAYNPAYDPSAPTSTPQSPSAAPYGSTPGVPAQGTSTSGGFPRGGSTPGAGDSPHNASPYSASSHSASSHSASPQSAATPGGFPSGAYSLPADTHAAGTTGTTGTGGADILGDPVSTTGGTYWAKTPGHADDVLSSPPASPYDRPYTRPADYRPATWEQELPPSTGGSYWDKVPQQHDGTSPAHASGAHPPYPGPGDQAAENDPPSLPRPRPTDYHATNPHGADLYSTGPQQTNPHAAGRATATAQTRTDLPRPDRTHSADFDEAARAGIPPRGGAVLAAVTDTRTRTRTATAAPAPARAPRKREPYLDNVKFILIALVVAGHALVPTLDAHSGKSAYIFIFAFHMPLFVMISGYLSRNFWNSNAKTNKLVDTFLIPYVIVEVGYALLRFATGQKWSLTIMDPAWLNWYLLALLLWRLSTPVWKRMRHPFLVSVVIYMLAGFSAISGDFSMDRFFGLLPFFVLGLMLQPKHFELLNRGWVKILAGVTLVGGAGVAILVAPHMSVKPMYFKYGFEDLGLTWLLGMGLRAAMLIASMALSFAVLALSPRGETWYTDLGTRTLYAYLLHGVPVMIGKETGLLDLPWLHGPLGVVAITTCSLLLTIILCLPQTRTLFKWLLEPRLVWLYRRPSR
ncbi:acyltransferase family protein [Sinosporangium siamense]|uniref:Acyltransferase 3 domain-containing protein n=1 Tax=Sinosporangium siamense TaxID=1367973 RepID=A0A919V4Z3_9ACTN|nr:acyltransferase family protein [Sinosporangium siamense]GII91008.1 hypothetical protein Ssi02_12390 [Sinosporangium siamense]